MFKRIFALFVVLVMAGAASAHGFGYGNFGNRGFGYSNFGYNYGYRSLYNIAAFNFSDPVYSQVNLTTAFVPFALQALPPVAVPIDPRPPVPVPSAFVPAVVTAGQAVDPAAVAYATDPVLYPAVVPLLYGRAYGYNYPATAAFFYGDRFFNRNRFFNTGYGINGRVGALNNGFNSTFVRTDIRRGPFGGVREVTRVSQVSGIGNVNNINVRTDIRRGPFGGVRSINESVRVNGGGGVNNVNVNIRRDRR